MPGTSSGATPDSAPALPMEKSHGATMRSWGDADEWTDVRFNIGLYMKKIWRSKAAMSSAMNITKWLKQDGDFSSVDAAVIEYANEELYFCIAMSAEPDSTASQPLRPTRLLELMNRRA